MTDFNYFSFTRPDALAAPMDSTSTSVILADGSTFPDPAIYDDRPYTVILGFGTDREEICTVTAKPTANTLTVIRGEDGTPAVPKNAGDTVVHGVSAREFRAIQGKLDPSGGTMTGELILFGEPTDPNGAVPLSMVEEKADKTTSVVAGNGLTGGGDISADRTLNVGAGTGISVAADTVSVDTGTIATRSYADAKVSNSATGGSTTVAPSQASIKSYVDGRIWMGTQASYNAIGTKDSSVLYVITG
jgi:hypothetical protein